MFLYISFESYIRYWRIREMLSFLKPQIRKLKSHLWFHSFFFSIVPFQCKCLKDSMHSNTSTCKSCTRYWYSLNMMHNTPLLLQLYSLIFDTFISNINVMFDGWSHIDMIVNTRCNWCLKFIVWSSLIWTSFLVVTINKNASL